MNLFNLMPAADRERYQQAQQQTREHLERWKRCKAKLDAFNRKQIVAWLDRLPIDEREKCRTVLNNIMAARKAKEQQQGEA
ncbi:hypothetical protein [Shewanella algae]|uniref:hypothetical protein n=1 Tax=Shewanella algae TaxID=38313 RepID=UPI001AADF9A9|nr:hypothetical protein [Shewanella algae]MBO2682990.1 hypothetical protein [Shewanella algae]MBO2695791.1 hypothetical protein [Shewanella algae]